MKDDYETIWDALVKGDINTLEECKEMIDDFPNGRDKFINRHWITNAIDSENIDSIEWVINQNVELNFVDDEGYTVLRSTLEMRVDWKYKLLKKILDLGVPVDIENAGSFTALHEAAATNDLTAFKILVQYGADINKHSIIEDYSNPYQFAVTYKCDKIIQWYTENT